MGDKAGIVGSGQAKLLAALAPDGTVQIVQVDAFGRLMAAPGGTVGVGTDRSRLRIWHPWELTTPTPDANGNRTLWRYLYKGTGVQAPDVYTRRIDAEGCQDLTIQAVVGSMRTGTPTVSVVLRGYMSSYGSQAGGALAPVLNIVSFSKAMTAAINHRFGYAFGGTTIADGNERTIVQSSDVRGVNVQAFDIEIYTGASGSEIPVTVWVIGRYR